MTPNSESMVNSESYADPLIDEVRQRRANLYASLGGTLQNLFKAIQRVQCEHPEKVGRPPSYCAPHPGSANHD